MEKTKKLGFWAIFAAAAIPFGAMVGAGVSSGVTSSVFFVSKGGYLSPLVSLVALAVLAVIFYIATEMSRLYGFSNSGEFFKEIYGKGTAGKGLIALADLTIICNLVFSTANAYVGCGSYLNQAFGSPLLLGAVIAAVICIIISLIGVDFFKKAQSVMSFVMFAILLIVYIWAIFGAGWVPLMEKFSTGYLPPTASTGSAALWFAYFVTNFGAFVSIFIFSTKDMKYRTDVRKFNFMWFILYIPAIVLPTTALLAFAPASLKFNIPTLFIMTDILRSPVTQVPYGLLLVFAFITTGAACIYTLDDRWAVKLPKSVTNPTIRRLIIPVIVSVFCVLFAPLGLSKLISLVTPYLAVLGAITVLFPILIVGSMKINSKRKELALKDTENKF